MTSNHARKAWRFHTGRQDALLAGVCSDLAARLGWNPWALRVIFIIGLLVQTLATGAIYLLLAFILPRVRLGRPSASASAARSTATPTEDSPGGRWAARQQRISELERRFEDMQAQSERPDSHKSSD